MLEALDGREIGKQRNVSLDGNMQMLRERCVAAVLLVLTRGLSKAEKRKLLKLAEAIYAEWQLQEPASTSKAMKEPVDDLQTSPNDSNRVVTLSALEFDESARHFLAELYMRTRSDGLIPYYKQLIASLLKLYSKTVEAPESDALTHTITDNTAE